MMNEKTKMKLNLVEHIKKYPMLYGAGWIALLGVLAWFFQSWPGGFWGWLGIAWGWLRETPNGYESASTTIRNLGLVIILPLAIWRVWVADRQSKTAQRSLLNEQYQKGAEMLGSEVLSVRLGGIYTLHRLTSEHPEEYHIQIIRLLCAFALHPTKDSEEKAEKVKSPEPEDGMTTPRKDIQAVMDAIGARDEIGLKLEKQEEHKPDLRQVKLSRASLQNLNLSNMRLSGADLSGAALNETNLSKAILNQAKLIGATFGGANMTGASFHRAKLNSAFFWDLPGPLRFIDYYNALKEGGVLKVDLSSGRLDFADLSNASLQGANLSGTNLTEAILADANLSDTKLLEANLIGANISGTKFSENGKIPATGLTQSQLDAAVADPENPPKLDGVLDAETGEQLIWRGGSLNK